MSPRAHVRVPSSLKYSDVSHGAQSLWLTLDDLAREHAAVLATNAQLCAVESCGRNTLKRYREELVRSGWLRYSAAWGRGVPSLWVPLNRVRAVTNPRPVDLERGPDGGLFDQGKRPTDGPLSTSPYKDRSREEQKRGGVGVVVEVTWCGRCAADTYRWVVDDDQRPIRRCPSCNPQALTEPEF